VFQRALRAREKLVQRGNDFIQASGRSVIAFRLGSAHNFLFCGSHCEFKSKKSKLKIQEL
jgi:hypothetical protein